MAEAEWKPVFVLPNIQIGEPIDGGVVVLVPAHDTRVLKLGRAHRNFKSFLGRFTDAFKVRIDPAVLLIRSDAPSNFYEVGALASFRDAVALSAIAYSHARGLKYSRSHDGVFFGNAFNFYPWMLDRDYEDLIGRTPAMLGVHSVKEFRGQSSPEMFGVSLQNSALDKPLLAALLNRWRQRYTDSSPAWQDIAVFRSLNMAYHASLLPAASDTTFYDIGRLISLWISAFEILVHPGANGKANQLKVFELLEKVPWQLRKCAEKGFETGKAKTKRTLASWLYQALYSRRNDFLHGNPVSPSALKLQPFDRNLFEYAAPLYRLALTGFLPLEFARAIPPSTDTSAIGAYIADEMRFLGPQRTCEEALLTSQEAPASLPKIRRVAKSDSGAGRR